MSGESRRLALVIASSHFTDSSLQQLPATGADAAALSKVLADPAIGNFAVKELIDRPSNEVRRAIEVFFADRKRDDLLLIYFSGHGLKTDDGKLYLAMTDTERGFPLSTTVPASFINEAMAACSSRRQVLILDCCHSGAFAKGAIVKGSGSADIREQFEGQGRIVLTASNAIQFAFVGDKVTGEGSRSVFTRHLVRGMETGNADLDGDGRIAVAELYDYVYARVLDETPNQRPQIWTFQLEGDLFIAKSVRGPKLAGTEEAKLAKQYRLALAAITAGHWQEALDCFERLAADQPNYRDVAERLQGLRRLAARMRRFEPSAAGWQRAVARFPMLATLLAIVLPNCLASMFNYAYNRRAIIVGDAQRELAFDYTALAVNGIAFPLGMALVTWLAWPVIRAWRAIADPKLTGADDLLWLRRRCLNVGRYAAGIGVGLWALAGPIYPLAIHVAGGGLSLRSGIYFNVSLAVGGLIAAAYPFFGVTFIYARILYAPLVLPGSTTTSDVVTIEWLSILTWRYLLLAASVPMLVIALAPLVDTTDDRPLLAALGLGSLAGLGLIVWLCRRLQRDLKVLKQAVIKSQPGFGEGQALPHGFGSSWPPG